MASTDAKYMLGDVLEDSTGAEGEHSHLVLIFLLY